MLSGIKELEECRVRAAAWPESVLCRGKYPIPFPGPSDTADHNIDPYLTKELQKNERAQAVKGDLGFRVLWFGAEPTPLHPLGGCGLGVVPKEQKTVVGE